MKLVSINRNDEGLPPFPYFARGKRTGTIYLVIDSIPGKANRVHTVGLVDGTTLGSYVSVGVQESLLSGLEPIRGNITFSNG